MFALGELNNMEQITSIEELESLYGAPVERALWKEIDFICEHYQKLIEASPFLVLATYGENGLDCSPRGDPAGFVKVVNKKQIMLPDRRGNNRLDSLRNIVNNPQVGLIFLIPGVGETLRISGRASILVDKDLCESFTIQNKPASSVLSIEVDKIYFQCQKAIARSKLWDECSKVDRASLPSSGDMAQYFSALKNVEFDGKAYDVNYAEYLKKTIY